MKGMLISIVAAGTSFLFLRLFIYVIPEIICILVTDLLVLVMIILCGVSLKFGVTKWRNSTNLWLLPILICVAYILIGIWVMPSIGPRISKVLFLKNLDAYSSVVNDFRKDTISCTNPCTKKMEIIQVPRRPAHVGSIWGVHCDDGGAIVLFLRDTDVPLLHEGYFFKDYGARSNCAEDSLSPESGWPRAPFVRHVVGQWYHFSDKPGL